MLLLNIDSKLPNLALHKIAMWHRLNDDEIVTDDKYYHYADLVYGSCILTRSKVRPNGFNGKRRFISDYQPRDNLIWGGTGFDCAVKLSPEIEVMQPKINYGFTVRGCPRKCSFCLVRQSEGGIEIVGDLYSIWDGASSWVVFFCNNVLAVPEHFERVCKQAIKEKVSVDWNQGLDIRLLNKKEIALLNQLKLLNGVRFAFDHPALEPIIREKVALMRQYYQRKYIFFYVLVGYNTTFEEDMHRLEVIKELGCRAYVMRHENTPKEKRYIRMAQWVNQFWTFAKYDFETFCIEYEKKA